MLGTARRAASVASLVLLALGVVACSGDPSSTEPGGAQDAAADSSPKADATTGASAPDGGGNDASADASKDVAPKDGASDAPPDGSSSDASSGCVDVTVSTVTPMSIDSQKVVFRGDVSPDVRFTLVLNRSPTPAVGTYSLDSLPVLTDAGTGIGVARLLLLTQQAASVGGQLELLAVSTPIDLLVQARLTDLELREINPTTNVLVPGGKCFHIARIDIDTRAKPGTPCTTALGCAQYEVCDPVTLECGPSHCAGDPPCPANTTCWEQSGVGGATYACYPTCVPFATPCASGFACMPLSPADQGRCVRVGTAKTGDPCSSSETSTGCAKSGEICGAGRCAEQCDTFASEPGCAAHQRCQGTCGDPLSIANVEIGKECPNLGLSYPCGDDGKAYRGTCGRPAPLGTGRCLRRCRPTKTDCPAGQLCSGTIDGYVCK